MCFLFGQAHNVKRKLKSLEGQFQPARWTLCTPGRDLTWVKWFQPLTSRWRWHGRSVLSDWIIHDHVAGVLLK